MKNTITFYDFPQRSKEWDAIRVGKVGGSESLGLTTAARMKTLIPKKLAEMLTGEQEDFFTSQAMQDGIDNEPIAKNQFEKENFVTVRDIGYVTNSKYKYLGLSPDGFVAPHGSTLESSKTAIEIKCPLPKAHVDIIIQGNVPTIYKPQIAQTFLILEDIDTVIFISFNAKVKKKPYYEIEITRSEFQEEIEKLEKWYLAYEKKIDEYLKLF